jgi:3-hydroxy-9,10-secoandrosta-1,3,5(10)-triene-9,17-dione monooxygenase
MSKVVINEPVMGTPLAQPEPDLTPEELIARAAALRPMLQAEQDESDARGAYSPAVHERLLQEGFYRILQPRRFGGYEFGLSTFVRCVMELSRGHPGAGWCFTLAASHGLVLAAHWPEHVQAELFGPDGEFRSPMVLGAAGTLKPVEGGYTLDGTWAFASGVPVSTHFMANAIVADETASGGPPAMAIFIVPRESIEILPDWGGEKSLGMRASGSNSVRVKGAFVPEHHVVKTPVDELMMAAQKGAPGAALHNNPMYLALYQGWFSTEFGAIFSGTARAAIDEYERWLRTKKMTLDPTKTRMHDAECQRALGEAMGLADAAEVLTLAAADLIMEQCRRRANEGVAISQADTFQVWGLAREACKLACDAVERLFKTAGASVAKEGQRLQRYFRDVQMYRVHIQSHPRFPTQRGMDKLGLEAPHLFGS